MITTIIDETSVLAVISFLLAYTNPLLHGHILFCDSAILTKLYPVFTCPGNFIVDRSPKENGKLEGYKTVLQRKMNLIEATFANSI